jgi:hypothetical protein
MGSASWGLPRPRRCSDDRYPRRRQALDNEDRLPWLEAVEEDDSKDGPGAAKLVAFVIIGLVAIGLIVGGLFWAGQSRDAAPPAPAASPSSSQRPKAIIR